MARPARIPTRRRRLETLEDRLTPTGTIRVYAFDDYNFDGRKAENEPYVEDVYLEFFGPNSSWFPLTTNELGTVTVYKPAGEYSYFADPPLGYDFHTHADRTGEFTLIDGRGKNVLLPLVPSSPSSGSGSGSGSGANSMGMVGNRVWHDLDEDGIKESGEPGIAGLYVEVRRVGDDVNITSGYTDYNGNYQVPVWAPDGTLFRVYVGFGNAYRTTIQNRIPVSDSADSDFNPSGWSDVHYVSRGGGIDTVDLGLIAMASGSGGSGPETGVAPLVISQVYASGGVEGATYEQDFIEIFNRSTATVSLSGLTVQHAAAGSTSWTVTNLSGSLLPGQYYLVAAGSAGSYGDPLPTSDNSTGTGLVAAGGKVAIVASMSALTVHKPQNAIDFVGYGDSDDFDGPTGPAPAGDEETAALRTGHGNYDGDDNAWDFTTGEPNPRNKAHAVGNLRPTVTMPAMVETALDTAFTFLDPIVVTDPDAGTDDLELNLTAEGGTLTLGSTTGLTFTEGDGTADAAMTFAGTLAELEDALDGLLYTPTTGFRGLGFVSAWVDDLGNNGSGSALVEASSTGIVVGGPLVAVADEVETDEDVVVDIPVMANDVWASTTWPELTVTVQPAHGTASVFDGLTPDDPSDDVIRYIPDPGWHGTDTITYEVSDGVDTHTADLDLTVNDVNDAAINSTGAEWMYSDEAEMVDVTFATPYATQPLTWAATGLPAGLSIDANSGTISGRPLYTEAGDHEVTLTCSTTASSDNDEDETTFTWHIWDVNRWNIVDDQFSQAGQAVTVPLHATDLLGNSLSYNITNLPPGVQFSPSTGIWGVPDADDAVGTWNVVAYVTGGGATDVRSFEWQIISEAASTGVFEINGTMVPEDDIGRVVDFGDEDVPSSIPFTLHLFQPYGATNSTSIKVKVMSRDAYGVLQPSTRGTIALSAAQTGSGHLTASVSDTLEGYLTPRETSDANEDIVLVAFEYVNNAWQQIAEKGSNGVTLTIGSGMNGSLPVLTREGKIDAKTTPSSMHTAGKYRIPPRAWSNTEFWITKTGEIGTKKLWLQAPRSKDLSDGQSDTYGRVALRRVGEVGIERFMEIKESDFLPVPDQTYRLSRTIEIAGHVEAGEPEKVYQTAPGSANKLWLGIFDHWEDTMTPQTQDWGPKPVDDALTKTQGFSVAAIPIKMSATTPTEKTNDENKVVA